MSWPMVVVNVASGLVGGYLLNVYGRAWLENRAAEYRRGGE